jgi:CheY-like chemotaxis protein
MNEGLRISEIAKKAGVLPSKIRYYTDQGLLEISGQTQGGHRLYDEHQTMRVLRKIEFLSNKGFSIEEIKQEMLKSAGKKKILVIDDEPEVGQLIKDVIESELPEAETRIAYDGFAAGRLVTEYMPDLIILDLMLPGVNGFEVSREIRKLPHMGNTRILAITGYDSPENRQKIMESGANDYMAKPMDINVLKEKIVALLGIEKKQSAGVAGGK